MQIRFSHQREIDRARGQGLRVVEGQHLRAGYRWRWYLIVALVSSPLIWLVGRLVLSALIQEAPAQLAMASDTIRAAESGAVEELPVRAGSRVQAGQLLVRLRNREWELRLRQLQGIAQAGQSRRVEISRTGSRPEMTLQRQAIALQQSTVQMYRSLRQSGGFSAAELLQAESQLNGQRLAAHELERRLAQDAYQHHGTPLDAQRAEQEHLWLGSRLKQLVHLAQHGGRVTEVFVTKGENVGPGTPLMQLERADPPVIWIYLQPLSGVKTWPGRPLAVQLPDGSWQAAQVIGQADLARRTPAGLVAESNDPRLALRIPARFTSPLAARWRVNQLPLTVRFPLRWP